MHTHKRERSWIDVWPRSFVWKGFSMMSFCFDGVRAVGRALSEARCPTHSLIFFAAIFRGLGCQRVFSTTGTWVRFIPGAALFCVFCVCVFCFVFVANFVANSVANFVSENNAAKAWVRRKIIRNLASCGITKL